MRSTFLFLFVATTFLSCNNSSKSNQPYRQNSVGNINSLQVIISDDLWNNDVGGEIRKYFAAPTDGLPQDEPLFN